MGRWGFDHTKDVNTFDWFERGTFFLEPSDQDAALNSILR
jgi:hypothetical protein